MPILEHKKETVNQILLINKYDFGFAQVVDKS
jgi:hypothetical protein